MAWKCLSPHQALQQFHTWCFTLRNIFWPLIKTGMTTTASSMGYLPKKQRRSFVMDLMGYLVFVPTEKLSVFCNLVKGHLQAGVLKPWTHSNKHRIRHDWSASAAQQISTLCHEQRGGHWMQKCDALVPLVLGWDWPSYDIFEPCYCYNERHTMYFKALVCRTSRFGKSRISL